MRKIAARATLRRAGCTVHSCIPGLFMTADLAVQHSDWVFRTMTAIAVAIPLILGSAAITLMWLNSRDEKTPSVP